MAQAATFVLQSERCISSEQSRVLIDYLETLRLPEEPINPEGINPPVTEKTEDGNSIFPTARLNDPSIYCAQVPFLIYDENKETIISRTAKGINEGKLNPYEIDWRAVTLYETIFVRDLLEVIDSVFIMDVAQAIDDEDKRHAREDGQYTDISSDFYGTGQGSAVFYSYMRDNWQNDSEYVSAATIAEGILDKRNKAEEYRKKIIEKKDNQTPELNKHIVEIIDDPESHLHINMKESIIDQSVEDEINALKKECEEWKRKYEEAITKEPEKAFNAQNGNPCFTNRQMGILLTAVGRITEKDNPPGKTTLGEVVEKISGYKATTASTNMRGTMPKADINAVITAIESKFPNLAAEVSKI